MVDLTELFACSWGDIRLFASRVQWDAGNTIVVHDLGSGDIHPVQPRGKRARRARISVRWDEYEGQSESPHAAFRRFEATTTERRLFSHPMDGAFLARVGDFEPSIDADSTVSADIEFIPDGEVVPVSPAGAGTAQLAGETAVKEAADALDRQLNAAGIAFPPERASKIDFSKSISLSIGPAFAVGVSASVDVSLSASASASASVSASASAFASVRAFKRASAAADASVMAFASAFEAALADAFSSAVVAVTGSASSAAFAFSYAAAALTADTRASVESWSEADVSTRKIMSDVARLSDSIATMIELGGFELDLQLWPSFVAAILLGDSIRLAALAATSETANVFVMRILETTALLPLTARVYGGRVAQDRARQVMELNVIPTPGWLDPGDYLMPARPTNA